MRTVSFILLLLSLGSGAWAAYETRDRLVEAAMVLQDSGARWHE